MLENIGMEAYVGRVRRELRAAGGTARQAAITAAVQLTAQEAQIARLAAGGLSDPEIASRLFLSPRTVRYHLGKVFTKLGITARPAQPGPGRRLRHQPARPVPTGHLCWPVCRFAPRPPGVTMAQ
jgi:DNA-binding CsgD family transcriptional regulator